VDTPKRHPFLPYQGFWENKWVIDVPLQGTNDWEWPALGRGGQAVVNLLLLSLTIPITCATHMAGVIEMKPAMVHCFASLFVSPAKNI
jgi:hypothetical protein